MLERKFPERYGKIERHLLRTSRDGASLPPNYVEAKGKHLGRPRVIVDARKIAALRKDGASWATICRETGLSKGTAQRALLGLPKNDHRDISGTVQKA